VESSKRYHLEEITLPTLLYTLIRNENKILPEFKAVLRKTISQKESHPKLAVGLFFKDLRPQTYGRTSLYYKDEVS